MIDSSSELALTLFQLGFHGAALVFLFLGYRLNQKVVEEDGPQLKEKLASVRFFLAMALAFFVVGAGLQVWSELGDSDLTTDLTMHLSPAKMPEGLPDLKLTLGGQTLEFDSGRTQAEIAKSTDLRVDAEALRTAIANLQAVNRQILIEEASESGDEVGVEEEAARSVGVSNESLRNAEPEELDELADRLSEELERPGTTNPTAVKTSLAWVQFSRGETVQARELLEQAVTESPDEKTRSLAYNNLGRVYLQQGDLEKSREAFEAAQSTAPSAAARKGMMLTRAAETSQVSRQ